jgi:hypothetical protein
MAGIDVTELFVDPDFVDTFNVWRMLQRTNEQGWNEVQQALIENIVGVVQPAGMHALQRLPDGINVTGAIEIFTMYPLTNGSQQPRGTGADEIEWNNTRYAVQEIMPWTNWGTGWIRAVCTLVDTNQGAPPLDM